MASLMREGLVTGSRWARFCTGILVFWMVSAASAGAGEWQYLAGDGTESTLDCFGDFEDAECAAETYLACATWHAIISRGSDYYGYGEPYHDLSLCEGTWPGNEGSYPSGLSNEAWNQDQRGHLLFRVSEPWVLEEEDMLSAYWTPDSNYFSPKVGDTIVDFESIGCFPGPPCDAPGRFDCPITYCQDQNFVGVETFRTEPSGTYRFPMGIVIMRHEQNDWRLIHIHSWRDLNHRRYEQSWRPRHYRIGPVEAE